MKKIKLILILSVGMAVASYAQTTVSGIAATTISGENADISKADTTKSTTLSTLSGINATAVSPKSDTIKVNTFVADDNTKDKKKKKKK